MTLGLNNFNLTFFPHIEIKVCCDCYAKLLLKFCNLSFLSDVADIKARMDARRKPDGRLAFDLTDFNTLEDVRYI